MKKTFFYKLLLISAFALFTSNFSQAQNPGPGGPIPTDPPPTAVPLDGGAGLLLAGGVAYGLKRLRRRAR